MGWLSNCFGCQRKERLPRLCSRQKSREHVKIQHRLAPLGSTLGSGRPLLKNDVGNSPSKRLLFPQVATQVRAWKEELCHVPPSCHTSLQSPVELLNVDSQHERHSSLAAPNESTLDDLQTSQRHASFLSGTLTDEKTQDGANAIQQNRPANLVLAVPNAPGFIMFPRKRSVGYVWQEPLSPVAEDECSICSEEEDHGLKGGSSASMQVEVVESEVTGVEDESNSGGSDTEIAPVRCSSPLIDITGKASEKRSKRVVGKENMFMGVVATEMSGSGREKQPSVLTPVGNIMQWRELKGDGWHTKSKTGESDKVGETDELVVEDTAFFKELQQSFCDITPQQRPSFDWDVQGIPNTNTKYREDQKVTWHSTPFEVRLNKALRYGGGENRNENEND